MAQDPDVPPSQSTSQSTSTVDVASFPPPRSWPSCAGRPGSCPGAQAVRAGLTAAQVDRLVARRRWVPLHPRVYRASEHPLTDEARLRAAVLWAGDGAVPCGRAALWWHGLLPGAPQTITLTVPGRCPDPGRASTCAGGSCRDHDVITLRGLTVPVRPLALLDAAVEAGPGGAALLIALRAHVRLSPSCRPSRGTRSAPRAPPGCSPT